MTDMTRPIIGIENRTALLREDLSIVIAKAIHSFLSNGEDVYEASNKAADAILALLQPKDAEA